MRLGLRGAATYDFFLQLLPPVPVPWPSPLLCPMLVTGSMAFHQLLWVSISRIGVSMLSSVLVGSSPYSCPECHGTADIFGDHQVGCGGNGDRIMRHNVIFCAAQSAALAPSPTSFLIPSPDQLISTSLPGAVVVLLRWMCMSYLLSSSRPWVRLPSPQATLCRLVSNGSSPLIFPTAGQRD